MENTEKSAAQWQEIVSEKDKEIAELRKRFQEGFGCRSAPKDYGANF